MNEEKEEMFLDELSYIKNDDYADVLLNIINMLLNIITLVQVQKEPLK